MEPGEIENANFRTQHHVLRCKSNDQDTFSQARYRRKSLAQYFYASQSLCDADGICQIIERRSHLYHALVDDRTEKSVNNYADAALILSASAGKSDASKWKSNLRSSRPVLAAVSKVTDCPGKCTAIDIFEQDLKLLASAAVEESCNAKAQSNSKFVPKTAGRIHLTLCQKKERPMQAVVLIGGSLSKFSLRLMAGSVDSIQMNLGLVTIIVAEEKILLPQKIFLGIPTHLG